MGRSWHPAIEAREVTTRFGDRDDALLRRACDIRQVRKQKRRLLLGPSLGRAAKQDYGRLRLSPQRQQRAEIGIGRNQHPSLTFREGEHGGVWCRLHVPVPDVLFVMASLCQSDGATAGDNALSTRNFTQR